MGAIESTPEVSEESPPKRKVVVESYMDNFVKKVNSYQEVAQVGLTRSATTKGAHSSAPHIGADNYLAAKAVVAYAATREAFSPAMKNGVALGYGMSQPHAYGEVAEQSYVEEQIKNVNHAPKPEPTMVLAGAGSVNTTDTWLARATPARPSTAGRNRFELMNAVETKASAKLGNVGHNGTDAWEMADQIKAKQHTQGTTPTPWMAVAGVKGTVDVNNQHIVDAVAVQKNVWDAKHTLQSTPDKAAFQGIKATIPVDSYLIDNQKSVHALLHADIAGTSTTLLPAPKVGSDMLMQSINKQVYEAVSDAKRPQYGESAIILSPDKLLASRNAANMAAQNAGLVAGVKAASAGVRRALFGEKPSNEESGIASAAELAAESRLASIKSQMKIDAREESQPEEILAHRYFELRKGNPDRQEQIVESVAAGKAATALPPLDPMAA